MRRQQLWRITGRFSAFEWDSGIYFIPLDKFQNKNKERLKNSWFYLGDIGDARGVAKSVRIAIKNGCKEFVLAGPEIQPKYVEFLQQQFGQLTNIHYLGILSYDKVPKYMNTYENFIYTPEIYDSFCRKVLEAQSSGMKVFVDNKRIGLFSYPEDYDLVDGCMNSNKVIVSIINKLLSKSD